MPINFTEVFEAQKALAIAPSWSPRNSEGLEIVCPLSIDGVIIQGLQFRATARVRLPDEMLTFQVEYHPDTEAGGPLARIEWRPMSPHNNKGVGPVEWQHKLITGCHHHPFAMNMEFAESEVKKGKLPVAIPLTESPANFPALLGFVGKEFRINNIGLVTEPPWAPMLV